MTTKQTKLGFDIRGVIVSSDFDNKFIKEAVITILLSVQKYGSDNIFIISKANELQATHAMERFRNQFVFNNDTQNFLQFTGVKVSNIICKGKNRQGYYLSKFGHSCICR